MIKKFGLTLGGLQQKILNLVLIFMLALMAVFAGVWFYQSANLNTVVGDASSEQQKSIEKVSDDTMHQVIDGSMTKTNALQAYIADDMFSDDNTARLADALQKANAKGGDRPQLIISIDQEGGNVTRLGQGTVMPGNMALGAANDTSLTKEAASLIGSELAALGINADFAPDVDVNSNPSNPIIGTFILG